jgi:hypothetical protein
MTDLTHYQRQAVLALDTKPIEQQKLRGIGKQTLLKLLDMGLAERGTCLFAPTLWLLTMEGLRVKEALLAAGVTRSPAPLFNPPPMTLFNASPYSTTPGTDFLPYESPIKFDYRMGETTTTRVTEKTDCVRSS